MTVRKYVVVDVPTTKILDGPFLWDSAASPDWTPPTAGTVMLASDAAAGGFTRAPLPVDNGEALRTKIPAAIDANLAFLAIATPTAAQVSAQVKLLTREVTALARLAAQLLDSTDGT